MFGDVTGIGESGIDRLSGCDMWWLYPKSSGCDGVGACGAHAIVCGGIGASSIVVVLVVRSMLEVESGIGAGAAHSDESVGAGVAHREEVVAILLGVGVAARVFRRCCDQKSSP